MASLKQINVCELESSKSPEHLENAVQTQEYVRTRRATDPGSIAHLCIRVLFLHMYLLVLELSFSCQE